MRKIEIQAPIFTNAKLFSEISGRSVKEIRHLCQTQVIPNEKSGRDYRIDTEESLRVLKERASDFTGHKYEMVAMRRPPKVPKLSTRNSARSGKKDAFLEKLAELITTDNGASA